jgi:hypothetical protein
MQLVCLLLVGAFMCRESLLRLQISRSNQWGMLKGANTQFKLRPGLLQLLCLPLLRWICARLADGPSVSICAQVRSPNEQANIHQRMGTRCPHGTRQLINQHNHSPLL